MRVDRGKRKDEGVEEDEDEEEKKKERKTFENEISRPNEALNTHREREIIEIKLTEKKKETATDRPTENTMIRSNE